MHNKGNGVVATMEVKNEVDMDTVSYHTSMISTYLKSILEGCNDVPNIRYHLDSIQREFEGAELRATTERMLMPVGTHAPMAEQELTAA